jgi:hypothetical protein
MGGNDQVGGRNPFQFEKVRGFTASYSRYLIANKLKSYPHKSIMNFLCQFLVFFCSGIRTLTVVRRGRIAEQSVAKLRFLRLRSHDLTGRDEFRVRR